MSGRRPSHARLGPGAEFDLVRRLVDRWGDRASGLGDDGAVLDVPAGERLVVSTDAFVEDVHFRHGWLLPREVGWRATAAALSDLAAMGARPLGIVVAVAVPERWRGSVEEIADGIGDAAAYANAPVVGGDTTAAAALSLTVTVLGTTAAPLRRDGARPGHLVYVTGALGGPLAALRDLQRGAEPLPVHRARFARPEPRVREALWLAAHGVSSAIDLSDGLASDAAHVAAASGVRMRLELDQLPILEELDPRTGAWAADERQAHTAAVLLDAARSGEEYELLVTAPVPLDAAEFVGQFGVRLTPIGRVEEAAHGEPPGVEAWLAGARVDPPAGYDHLSE